MRKKKKEGERVMWDLSEAGKDEDKKKLHKMDMSHLELD